MESCGKLRVLVENYRYSFSKGSNKYTFVLHKGVENFVLNENKY